MAETPRLLFVHAHPDDESLNNGATIAHYIAAGAQVRVVTCTLGEEGEVIGERWAELAVDRADQLGGYRVGELTAALRAMGVSEPVYLGGAGRWRDSGMEGTVPRGRPGVTRFIDADEREAVGALVAIIRELRPHVVVTYDPNGGYGHPDHVQAHVVTTAAVAAAGSGAGGAGSGDYPGEPWTVPKFYWTVLARSAFKAAYDELDPADVLPEWTVPQLEDIPFGFADEDIDAVVEAGPDAHAAKVAALGAHATQVVVGPKGKVCAVSNNFAMPILSDEHYVLVGGAAGDRDERGWETDLLAGLGFDGAATR